MKDNKAKSPIRKNKNISSAKKTELKPLSGHGGYRPGSGRPAGSRTIISRKHLSEIIDEQTILKIVKKAVEIALAGDVDMQKYLMNHCFGVPIPKRDENDSLNQKINILIDC